MRGCSTELGEPGGPWKQFVFSGFPGRRRRFAPRSRPSWQPGLRIHAAASLLCRHPAVVRLQSVLSLYLGAHSAVLLFVSTCHSLSFSSFSLSRTVCLSVSGLSVCLSLLSLSLLVLHSLWILTPSFCVFISLIHPSPPASSPPSLFHPRSSLSTFPESWGRGGGEN